MSEPRKNPTTGKWEFVVDTKGVNGRRQQIRRRGFATKRAARAALTAIKHDRDSGTFIRPTKVTLGRFLLDEWLPAKRSGLRASTVNSYERAIALYIVPTLGDVPLGDVDGAMLNALYARLLEEGRGRARRGGGAGLSPKTVRNIHGVLAKAFHDAVRWNRVLRNPCHAADPPKGTSPEMRSWTSDEIRAFIAATSTHRWAGVWALLATTGMRRGEALGLRWRDLDLDAGRVTIQSTRVRFANRVERSTPKTARGNRTITVGPATVAALRAWRKQQASDRLLMGAGWQNGDDLVVTIADGSAPNPEAFSNLFAKLVKRAGLPPIRLHDLRHSYASAALRDGVPVKVVSQRIGHADVGVTLKVYAHVLPGDDEAAAHAADGLLRLLESQR